MSKIILNILIALLLTGCSNPAQPTKTDLQQSVELTQSLQKTIKANISQIKNTETSVTLEIFLENPESRQVVSAQTWLAYNPWDLRVVRIETNESDFDISAPGESDFDQTLGLIKLGRSKKQGFLDQKKIQMAQVVFEKLRPGFTNVDFYNYQEDLSGNTNVNINLNDQVYNLLQKPNSPAITIQ